MLGVKEFLQRYVLLKHYYGSWGSRPLKDFIDYKLARYKFSVPKVVRDGEMLLAEILSMIPLT